MTDEPWNCGDSCPWAGCSECIYKGGTVEPQRDSVREGCGTVSRTIDTEPPRMKGS